MISPLCYLSILLLNLRHVLILLLVLEFRLDFKLVLLPEKTILHIYIASLPKFQTLNIVEDDFVIFGYSYVADIIDED